MRALREAAGHTRETAGTAASVTAGAIRSYELGIADPSARVLVALARLYGVPVEALCRDPDPAGTR
jgi:transcriptional regulator with XRE-family HTH domain